MNIKFIVMTILLFTILPKAEAQSCTGCTNPLSGGANANNAVTTAINVTAGQTVCLTSGFFEPSALTIANGGTLCVGSGVTLNYPQYGFTLDGTIINHGIFIIGIGKGKPKGSANLGAGTIENYGTITQSGYLGSVALTINNHGVISLAGPISNFSGSIMNYGLFQTEELSSLDNAYFDNRDSFIVTNKTELKGTFDNSGYAYFYKMTSGIGLSATVNNYGVFKVEGALNIGASTYFTNDSLTIFNVSSVNFAGPMLTNNSRINVLGDFEVNSPLMDFVNTGMLYVSGVFQFNAAASAANNCRIFAAGGIVIHGAGFKNYGLLWTTNNFTITGGTLKNYKTGFIRGVNFSNNDSLTGFGKFYFTGTTYSNGGGKIIGDSVSNKILFYTPSGGNPFPLNSGIVTNVTFLTPSSITPLDTTSFDCNGTPAIPAAGNPPYVRDTLVHLCDAAPVTFHLITDSLIKPYDNTYSIKWSALKLFSVGGVENTTSLTVYNSTHTTILGTFVADTTNKTIVFTPDPSFYSGTIKAQFKAADTKPGDPITYSSGKATITINITPVPAPVLNDSASGF